MNDLLQSLPKLGVKETVYVLGGLTVIWWIIAVFCYVLVNTLLKNNNKWRNLKLSQRIPIFSIFFSSIHGLIGIALGFIGAYGFCKDSNYFQSEECQQTPHIIQEYFNLVSGGYFLADTLFLYFSEKGPQTNEYFFHHIAGTIGILISQYSGGAFVTGINITMLSEFSTVFINYNTLRDFLEIEFGIDKIINGCFIILSFIFGRIVLQGFIISQTLVVNFQYFTWYMQLNTLIYSMFYCLNYYWFSIIIHQTYLVLFGKQKRE